MFALGVSPGKALDEKEHPVLGFFLRATDDVFSMYALTPGRFLLFEMAANGNTLTVATPISRVRRVVEESIAGEGDDSTLVVTVELDADRRVTSTSGEYLEGLLPEVEGQVGGRIAGRVSTQSVETFTVYRIQASEEDERDALWEFALALRNALGT